MHEKVCGRTFPGLEQAFESTQCARNIRCSRPNRHRGVAKSIRSVPCREVAEEAAAAEAEAAEGTKETEQMEQSQADPLPQADLMHPPDLVHLVSGYA